MSEQEKAAWKQRSAQLTAAWAAAAENEIEPESAAAQALAARHVEWLTAIPGTPANKVGSDVKGYVVGLAEMYVSDQRFGANYRTVEGKDGAAFVRDALRIYARANL
jgi:hypothetical protein